MVSEREGGEEKHENLNFDPNRNFTHSRERMVKTVNSPERYFQPVLLPAICVGLVHLGQTPPLTGREVEEGGISGLWEETKILCTKITGNKSNRVSI